MLGNLVAEMAAQRHAEPGNLRPAPRLLRNDGVRICREGDVIRERKRGESAPCSDGAGIEG